MIFLLLIVSTPHFCISITMTGTHTIHFRGNSTYSGTFTYRGNVSSSDRSLLISELAPGKGDTSLRVCAAECHSNLDCNAVEICSSATANVCRFSRKITTSLTTGKDTCSRYELEHTCGWDSYFDRRKNICQCVLDCECDAVTPSIGSMEIHNVKLDGQMFLANCMNSTGHIWTMIQRRVDGSVNFYRGWAEYKSGFGDLNSEFWIGLDNIRLLVNNGYTVLRVELEELKESVYAEYDNFYIAGEDDKYRIHVSGYKGNAGDGISCSLQYCNNNAQFTTYDEDNDSSASSNNAQLWRGAWWYHSGHTSNLNGEYGNNNHGQGMNWYFFKGWKNSLSATRMMLRRA
ncbi:ficolin-1-like isoform X1 [Ostrea edulis]|uniref:ficolin-1-like isoform X1 n=1 Tax=Ostrea edulis TaxID=37623 RepID=UPI0024AF8716|nr:ficolin-1-like isoform X1 [Ostrea edulis]